MADSCPQGMILCPGHRDSASAALSQHLGRGTVNYALIIKISLIFFHNSENTTQKEQNRERSAARIFRPDLSLFLQCQESSSLLFFWSSKSSVIASLA